MTGVQTCALPISFRKQALAKPCALHSLEPITGNDLVGVDIAATQGHCGAFNCSDSFHAAPPIAMVGKSSGVANVPLIAVAAATAGDTK